MCPWAASVMTGQAARPPGGARLRCGYSRRMAQTIERPRTAGPGTGLGGHWRVIVRNDDHNTFDHVARTLSKVVGMTLDQGYKMADRIHNASLAIVWSGHLELAEHYWDQLAGAGLTMAPLEQG